MSKIERQWGMEQILYLNLNFRGFWSNLQRFFTQFYPKLGFPLKINPKNIFVLKMATLVQNSIEIKQMVTKKVKCAGSNGPI